MRGLPIEQNLEDGLQVRPQRFALHDPFRRRVFILICIDLFVGQLGYAVFTPFFPGEASSKDLSESMVGWVLGIFQFTILLVTPFAVRFIPVFGPTNLLNMSNFLIANSNIAFAMAWYVASGPPFFIACLVTRIVNGIGVAIAMVVGYGLLPYLFVDKISTGASILETVVSSSFVIAPVFGAVLYQLGGRSEHYGYILPSLVLGVLQNILGVYCICFFPKLPMPAPARSNLMDFSLCVLVPCLVCTITSAAVEFVSPSLEVFLRQKPFQMSVTDVGFVYGIASLTYACAGPLVGFFDDRFSGRYGVIITAFGSILLGLSYVALGTAVSEVDNVNIWTAVAVMGVGGSLGLVPTYNNIYIWSKHLCEDDAATATSVLYNVVYAAGGFVGPTLAGYLSQFLGIGRSYEDFGIFVTVFGIALFVWFLASKRKQERAVAIVTARAETPKAESLISLT